MPTIAQSYLNAEEQLRRRGWLGSKSTCLQCRMTNSLPFTVVPMVSDQAYIQAVPLSPYLGPCSSDRREGTVCYRDPLKVYCFFLFFFKHPKYFKNVFREFVKTFQFFFCKWHEKGSIEKIPLYERWYGICSLDFILLHYFLLKRL